MTPALRIVSVDRDRDRYRELLLLADEQWDMVELYLHRGKMFAAYAQGEGEPAPEHALGCMIVTDEGVNGEGIRIAEIKSLAVKPAYQRCGVGRALLEFAAEWAASAYGILRVGTGDSPLTVPFYEACGFVRSRVVANFFIDNYDHPIIEAGVLLKDMVILERPL